MNIRGNVVPSLSDLPSLIRLPSDPNDIVVSVRGFESVDADSVSVDIDTYASPSTVSPASIDTIVAGLRRLPLHATIDESPGVLISFQRDLTHVGHAQMDITASPRDLGAVRRVVDEAARHSGLKAEIARTVVRTPARRSRLARWRMRLRVPAWTSRNAVTLRTPLVWNTR